MNGNGTAPMAEKLRQRTYINERCSGHTTFADRSRLKNSHPKQTGILKRLSSTGAIVKLNKGTEH